MSRAKLLYLTLGDDARKTLAENFPETKVPTIAFAERLKCFVRE